ncbi:hypothetical protein HN51_032150 [Arachis hypogaea]
MLCLLFLRRQASTDQSAIDINIPNVLCAVTYNLAFVLGSIAVMSQAAWQVFIVFIPVVAACIWYQQHYSESARELARLVGICQAPVIQHFSETISGSTTIRAFEQESRFGDINMKLTDRYSLPKMFSAIAMEWLCFRLDILSSITFAFCLIFLVSFPNAITPGIAGLAVTYGLNLNSQVVNIVWFLCNLENKIISVERIFQYTSISSEPPLVIEDNQPDPSWPPFGEVRYAPHLPLVLCGLTCTFAAGAKNGIVGRTGSGKTTLVQTLFRLVEPLAGKILIDRSISKLSIIPQDPTIFEGTIRNNLDPREEYTDEQIWEQEYIIILSVVNTCHVTENGENWSMGQRQLVCLGHVLIKKSKIVVLDEATASVDAATSY